MKSITKKTNNWHFLSMQPASRLIQLQHSSLQGDRKWRLPSIVFNWFSVIYYCFSSSSSSLWCSACRARNGDYRALFLHQSRALVPRIGNKYRALVDLLLWRLVPTGWLLIIRYPLKLTGCAEQQSVDSIESNRYRQRFLLQGLWWNCAIIGSGLVASHF